MPNGKPYITRKPYRLAVRVTGSEASQTEAHPSESAAAPQPTASPPLGADPAHPPYVGPQPFPASLAQLFFGRDSERDSLVKLLAETRRRVVLLYSPSGAGKTSLLNTALREALGKSGFLVLPIARPGVLPPKTEEPQNPYTLAAIASMEEDSAPPQTAPVTWSRYLDSRVSAASSGTVLIVDQLEEIVTTDFGSHKMKSGFFLELAQAIAEHPALRVILAFREDYLSELERLAGDLEPHWTRFPLQRLNRNDAAEAIAGPAKACGVTVEAQVVAKLVDELARVRHVDMFGTQHDEPGKFVEPLQLQVVCEALWATLAEGKRRIGWDEIEYAAWPYRAEGQIIRREDAVPAFVESVLQGFCGRAIQAAASALPESGDGFPEELIDLGCQQFVSPRGTRLLVHQGEENTGDLPNRVVEELARRHLLRVEERNGERWFELAHDTLVDPVRARAGRVDDASLWNLYLRSVRTIAAMKRARQEGIDENSIILACCLEFAAESGSRKTVTQEALESGAARMPEWVVDALLNAGLVRRSTQGSQQGFELSDRRLVQVVNRARFDGDHVRRLRTLTELSGCMEKCRRSNGGTLAGWFESYESVLRDLNEVAGLTANEAEFVLRASLASPSCGEKLDARVALIGRSNPQSTEAIVAEAVRSANPVVRRNAAAALRVFAMPGREAVLFDLAMEDAEVEVRHAAAAALAAIDSQESWERLFKSLRIQATGKRALAVSAWVREAPADGDGPRRFDQWWNDLPRLQRARLTMNLASLRLQRSVSRIIFACAVATLATVLVTMTTRALLAGFGLTLTQTQDVGWFAGWFHGVTGALTWGVFIGGALLCWWFVVEGCRPWRSSRAGPRSAIVGGAAGLAGGIVNTIAILKVQTPVSLHQAGWLPLDHSPPIEAFTVTGLGYTMLLFGTLLGLGSGLTTIRILLRPKWSAIVARHARPASFIETARVFGSSLRCAVAQSWSILLPMLIGAAAFYGFLSMKYDRPSGLRWRILGECFSIWAGGVGIVAGLLFGLFLLRTGISIPGEPVYSLMPEHAPEAGRLDLK